MSKKFAVLGSPISHSLSPQIHNAAFAAQGLHHSYDRFDLAQDLDRFVSTNGASYAGFSVTMPLKDEALALSDTADELAQTTKSVNTLLRSDAGWLGFNTDVLGFRAATAEMSFESVSVLGTGATARSALVAFSGMPVKIWGRDGAKAAALAEQFHSEQAELDSTLEADLVVSTLPKGALGELVGQRELPGCVFDVVYADWPTAGSEAFASSISGLELLLHQALYQQRIFAFGEPHSPLDNEATVFAAMRTAVEMAE